MKKFFLSVATIFSLFTLSACVNTNNSSAITDTEKIYEIAKECGFEGSYLDWLNYIEKVSVNDGRYIELSVIDNKIHWRYVGTSNWTPIYSIDDIIGPEGGNNPNTSEQVPSTKPSEDINNPDTSEQLPPSIDTSEQLPPSTDITIPDIENPYVEKLVKVNHSTYSDTFKVIFKNGEVKYFVTAVDFDGNPLIFLDPLDEGYKLNVEISPNGSIVVEGYDTMILVPDIPNIAVDPSHSEISAYQRYVDKFDYKDDEKTWVYDIQNNLLDEKKTKYRVEFIVGGAVYEVQNVIDHKTCVQPKNPEVEGYRFNGWFYNYNYFNFDTKITSDMVIEAQFVNTYKVTFELVPGEIYKEFDLAIGDVMVVPQVDDPNFEGWYIDDELITNGMQYTYAHDVIVSAKFKQNEVDRTYNTITTVSPSNWNELTYQDTNDLQIIDYISSDLFSYDYKFDESNNIISGEYVIKYDAATKLQDVTYAYRSNSKWNIPSSGSGYAYKITLRDDLKWNDGTPITADDFVYSMKEQLNPLFRHYRADTFYNGANVIHGAKDYVFQGMKGWYKADTPYQVYSPELDDKLVFTLGSTTENAQSQGVEEYEAAVSEIRYQLENMGLPLSVNGASAADAMIASFPELSSLTVDQILALEGKTFTQIKANPELRATWDVLINWWQVLPNEELNFFITNYEFPEVAWENVGIFAQSKNELVLIFDKPQEFLKEDGSLSYKVVYNLPSLPLVKKDLYEVTKVEPVVGSNLWTTTYNTSSDTTASWGPYSLSSYDQGKGYVLERNPYWYGYNIQENKDLYQTDRIVCKTINEWDKAWLAFQKGEIDEISIDPSIASEYRKSSQAIFTPSDFVGSIQLQSNMQALKARESDGINKSILGYKDFRKAISFGFDRELFTNSCTNFSKPAFGLFNSMHYYDVENGGSYRNNDITKKVLCDVYDVDMSRFDGNLNDGYQSITGYDLTKARKLLDQAYDQALANGDIKETDKVVLTFGSGSESQQTIIQYEFFAKSLEELARGTKLEGRLTANFESHNEHWANDFRAGAYDICLGGWSGSAWDPGYLILAYLSPDYMYSTGWDTYNHMLTLSLPGAGENGTDINDTLSLMQWYDCLNGGYDAKYNLYERVAPAETRLKVIAALEKEILDMAYTIPVQSGSSASLMSFKIHHLTNEYNTFMGFGGIKYLMYNYTDAEWSTYVNNHNLDYRK